MKTLVCYGDSNTYGYNPHNSLRYDDNILWTTILQSYLKDEYKVYNEGLNGRTTAFNRVNEEYKNGLLTIVSDLDKYDTIDYLTIMLGTNDVSADMNLSIEDITNGLEKLLLTATNHLINKQNYLPKIMIIVPAHVLPNYHGTIFEWQIDDTTIYKSNNLANSYKDLADKYGCLFLDCTNELEVSPIDCEHLTENGHKKLAELVYKAIR